MSVTAFKQIADNAITTTSTSLSSTGVTSVTLSSATNFPVPGNGYIVTLWNGNDPTTDTNMEKVLVTANSSGVLTITATTKTHQTPTNIAILDTVVNITDTQAAINNVESGANQIPVSQVSGVTFSGTPVTGYIPTATSATTATWQAPAGGSTGNFSNPVTVTSTSATSLAVGANGTTNPALVVNSSAASSATGIQVVSSAAGSGALLSVTSSATNEVLTISGKGFNGVNLLGNAITTTNNGGVAIYTANSSALAVGQSPLIAPVLKVVTTASGTGLGITPSGAGSGVTLGAQSTGANENMFVDAKGTGQIVINHTTTVPAGGSTTAGVSFTNAGNLGVYSGTGAPTFSAMNGAIYINTAATASGTRLYINSSGASTAGTSWTAVF